ncbi:MAG: hypothetical protein ACOVO2_06895 [Emticicia sp.]|uniref:hypothetical protein n=1 Tax=Emticicia sp. TaxID=1930953 RepID=UPI003BA48C30
MKKIYLLVIFLLAWSFSFAQSKPTKQTYEGMVNKFPISLSLTFDANLVYGTLTYKRVGQPIKVIGSIEGDDFSLHEFVDKTEISGLFFGKRKDDVISGLWLTPSGKEMKFSVKKTSSTEIDKPELKSVTGSYAYSFGKDGGTGNMYVQQVAKDKIILEIQAVKGPPSYNQAIIEKTTLKLVRNEAIYENNEFGKCLLKLSFFEGGANIIYLNDSYECGFGNAASVVGKYLKFDAKAPKFEKTN